MKIGMIAPLFESCPPQLYGGTERVVANLCNGLVQKGHDVTLFASGDSQTQAKLISITPQSLRLAKPPIRTPFPYIIKEIDIALKHAKDFDIIHNHIGYMTFPFIATCATPWVTTLHGRLDLPDHQIMFQHFQDISLVSISYAQRKSLPTSNWKANIYHGIDLTTFQPSYNPGKYLAFLGRICPDKGIEEAINVAKAVGIPLKIAAKVDKRDVDYYETRIKKLIDGHHIEYIGEITEAEKSEFLNNALALLFTIDWPEPFGLAVIESYACGTPVITRPIGSMPELVQEGKTGFLRSSAKELINVVDQVHQLDRKYIRKYAEDNFSLDKMTTNYVKLYQQSVDNSKTGLKKQESLL